MTEIIVVSHTHWDREMTGCDHTAPQPDLTQVLQALNRRLPERLVYGSLADFVARIRAQNPQLPIVRGELCTPRHAFIIPGTEGQVRLEKATPDRRGDHEDSVEII